MVSTMKAPNSTRLHRIAEHLRQLPGNLGYIADDIDIIINDESLNEYGLSEVEASYILSGQYINAIKELRGRFLGTQDPRGTLKGAKDAVEAAGAKMGIYGPEGWRTPPVG